MNQLHSWCDFANFTAHYVSNPDSKVLGNFQQSVIFQLPEVSGSAPPAASWEALLALCDILQLLGSSSDFLPHPQYLEAVEPLQVPWIQPPVSSKSSRYAVDLMGGAD